MLVRFHAAVEFIAEVLKSGRSKFVAISSFGSAKGDKRASHVNEGEIMVAFDLPTNA